MNKEEILEVKISSDEYDKILQYISNAVTNRQKLHIVTPNPEMVVMARSDKKFKEILNQADISLPDGRGLVWAARVLDKKIEEQITGTDLMSRLCEVASDNEWNIFLLGGREGVGIKTKKILEEKYPGIKILGVFEGDPTKEKDVVLQNKIKSLIGKEKIDLLFVAYGAPKQEKWISRNLQYLSVSLAIGVGGAFNYISGEAKRAPKWLRSLGFEWLFRLITEPWRWKRQLRLITFAILIFREKWRNLTKS